MRIHALVLTSVATPEQPFLVDAWDAAMVEDNPGGWRRVVYQEALGHDVHTAAEVVIDVPTQAVLDALRAAPPVLPGHVIAPDCRPP